MQAALDLTRAAWRRQCGDITVYGSWWRREAGGSRPCLALIPTFARPEDCIPCVVLLEQAWIWSEEIGNGAHCAQTAFRFAQALGLNVSNVDEVFRVAGIIRDHLGDLVSMPPEPQAELIVIGEARAVERESGKVIEHELVARA